MAFVSKCIPGGSEGKVSAYNAGDPGSIPGSGRSPGEGNGNRLQFSCLENPMDRGAWQATVPGVAKSQTQLSDFMFTFTLKHKITSLLNRLLRFNITTEFLLSEAEQTCLMTGEKMLGQDH